MSVTLSTTTSVILAASMSIMSSTGWPGVYKSHIMVRSYPMLKQKTLAHFMKTYWGQPKLVNPPTPWKERFGRQKVIFTVYFLVFTAYFWQKGVKYAIQQWFIKVWDHPTPPTHSWVNCPKFSRLFYGFSNNNNYRHRPLQLQEFFEFFRSFLERKEIVHRIRIYIVNQTDSLPFNRYCSCQIFMIHKT